MKKQLLFVCVCLTLYQTFVTDSGKASAENAVPDTLSWKWEVSSTVSTRTKTCTLEFSDNLLVSWGDGVTEWIPDSMSAKAITHVYTVQANYECTAIGVGISYFKADSRRVLSLDTRKAPGLTYLSCTSNQISSLDLTRNTLLVSLYCGSNSLTSIDLSKNLLLQNLTCSDNQLAKLDLSKLSVLKKVTCHTNVLTRIAIYPSGALSYLSCYGCSLTAENLDSIFLALPTLSTVSTSKNLYVLNNPGSSSCHSEIAAAKKWTLDRVITQSYFYMPSVSGRTGDSIQANIYLKNTAPAIAFEMNVQVPDGFELDTLRSALSGTRKGQHLLSIARMSASEKIYKIMAYSLVSKDVFSGSDGSILELHFKAPSEIKTYTLDIQNAILMDSLTNLMELSITDGQMIVTPATMAGDANSDKKVDVTDVVNLVAWINGRHPTAMDSIAADIDGNGIWNVADITKLVVIINSGVSTRSALVCTNSYVVENLSLYRAEEVVDGNNLFVRQSADEASCLELCLDNVDQVQAFQVDLLLPEGLSLQTGVFAQQTERSSEHTLSINRVAENRYRLLSYSMKPNVAYSGNTGALSRLKLEGIEKLTSGVYPIIEKQPVLTGMSLNSVVSKSYDAVVTLGNVSDLDKSISLGADNSACLWVHGQELLKCSVWDFSGKLVIQKSLNGVEDYRIPMPKGNYIVEVNSRYKQGYSQKVAVK